MRRFLAALALLLLPLVALAGDFVPAAKTNPALSAAFGKVDTAWPNYPKMKSTEQPNFRTALLLMRAADLAVLHKDTTAAKTLASKAMDAAAGTYVSVSKLQYVASLTPYVTAATTALPSSKLADVAQKIGRWDLVGLEPISP